MYLQVLNGLEKHLIPSLHESPLDIDSLRLYVILPEYEMFTAAERYKTLAVPLAKKLLSLHADHQSIIGQYEGQFTLKAMLHGAIFLATCNAILLLRDVN
jgi:E3 ubiquitin-protein ligase HERC3